MGRKFLFGVIFVALLGTVACGTKAEGASGSVSEKGTVSEESKASENIETYDVGDIDGNGINEYIEINNASENGSHLTFYWNQNAIYEYDDTLSILSAGTAEYLDLDSDGEKEIFFTFTPSVNSMPLTEYMVLKQTDSSWKPLEMIHGEVMSDNGFPISVTKGAEKWQAVISCDNLDKEVTYDVEGYYSNLKSQLQGNSKLDYLEELVSYYENEFVNFPAGEDCGDVAAWGIWEIKSGEYEGQPCLIAKHGILGHNSWDGWGNAYVYFDYDANGNTRFLDIQFSAY